MFGTELKESHPNQIASYLNACESFTRE